MSNQAFTIYIVILLVVMLLVTIIPSRREKKKKAQLMESLAVGDYCCTVAGMYGKIIDITNEMVIVEFGGKSCRIPMLKSSIVSVEKPDAITTGMSDDAKNAQG